MTQARGLYTFDGSVPGGELSFQEGEILNIIRQDVGDGWWEAKNSDGQTGFIPEAFVEIVALPEPSIPPPPPPPAQPSRPALPQQWTQPQAASRWDAAPAAQSRGGPAGTMASQESQDGDNYWDDSWDEDDDAGGGTSGGHAPPGYGHDTASIGSGGGQAGSRASDAPKFSGTLRGWGKYHQFAKAGGEAYLLGVQGTTPIDDHQQNTVEDGPDGPRWVVTKDPFTCSIFSPKKDSKMKGLKSFITYQLTPSFSNIQVSRRYKHFDWLHKRLEEKYHCLCVPPLPDKQVSGRFEEDFIQERMKQLQEWLNRMVAHPVICKSEVLHHFLTCTDEKRWKKGKRAAEKDEYQGAKFFLTIQTPPVQLELVKVDESVEQFHKFVGKMDDGVKHLSNLQMDFAKRHMGPLFREFQKMGGAYDELSKAFEMDSRTAAGALTGAIRFTGETYNEIGNLYREQPRSDIHPLTDILLEYRGLLTCFPEVLAGQKAAAIKVREVQAAAGQGTMSESDNASVSSRADVIGYGVMAEMNYFQEQRVLDFQEAMKRYLSARINFYTQIADKLQGALAAFDF